MPPKKRPKRLVQLVAVYPEGYQSTLEDDLREISQILPMVSNRILQFAGKTWHGLRLESQAEGFVFQYAASVPGEEASVLPSAGASEPSVPMDTAVAPEGKDYSDGDMICLVCGNNVFACPSGLTDKTIASFLHALFKEAGLPEETMQLTVRPMADIDKVRILRSEGIKSVEFRATMDQALFESLDGGRSLICTWLGRDRTLAQCLAESNAKVVLSIAKSRLTVDRGLDWMNGITEEALDGCEEYVIVTERGTRLTNASVGVSKRVGMERFGKSVYVDEAVRELVAFKNDTLHLRA